MLTTWFPHGQVYNAGEVLIELMKKFPQGMPETLGTHLVSNVISVTKEGYKAINVSEIKEEKLKEFLEIAHKQLIMLVEGVEGYKYELEYFYPLSDVMKWLGIKLPK